MSDRDELIKRLAAALVVSDARRRSGDPQTRVRLDHYLPSVGALTGALSAGVCIRRVTG